MTANHSRGSIYRDRRHPDALLAGVCADLAQRLGWNVWAIRALFVIALMIKTIAAAVVYAVLALVIPHFRADDEPEPDLSSPELRSRNERIADLERRFRDLEKNGD